MTKLFKICDSGLKFTFYLFGKLNVEGLDNVPINKSFVSVSNHLSIVDPALCASAIGKEPRFLAKKELFKFPFNILLKFYGAFPINRGSADFKAFNWAKKQLLSHENSLLIFPEGTRSKNQKLQKGQNGATLLAIESNSVILPIAITGSEKCKSFLQFLFPNMNVNIKIGKPFEVTNLPSQKNKDLYNKITEEIMKRISNLLPVSYRSNKNSNNDKDFFYTRLIDENEAAF